MRIVFFMIAATLISGCAAPIPPETPPTDYNNPPAIIDGGYAEYIVRADFPYGVEETRQFMDTGSRMLMAMPDTDKIARPVAYEILQGNNWPETGAVRRLEFSDGHYAMERVLEFSPERFRYQVWGFTSATAKNVDYIVGEQTLRPDGEGSDFLWIYRVKPNAGWKRRFVQKFVNDDVSVLLDTATASVVEAATP